MGNINDKVLVASIRGKLPCNGKNRTGDIDFLMYDQSNIVVNIKNDEDIVKFEDYLDKFTPSLADKEEYHIYHYVDYLKKEYKDETRSINFDIFNSSNGMVLYELMSKYGNTVLINSSYIYLLFLPSIDNINSTIMNSIKRLSTVLDKDMPIECRFYSHKKNNDKSFNGIDEVINYIEEKKKKLVN